MVLLHSSRTEPYVSIAFKPFTPFPGKHPISTDAKGIGIPLCRVEDEPVFERTSLAAGFLPDDWCINHITLRADEIDDISKLPRLGPKAISEDFQRKYLGPLDSHGFKKSFYDPKTGTGTYFGFRDTDITPSGGPIVVTCSQYIHQPNYWCGTQGFGRPLSLGIGGVRARRFRWHVLRIDPSNLRQLYWRSQHLLEWLATPPNQRASKISDNMHGLKK